MATNDIISVISTEGNAAVDQIIEDSRRLHIITNGDATQSAITEDGSPIPSVRKAIVDNFYYKTPVILWKQGSSVTVFNQLYSFTDDAGTTSWWYAPAATTKNPIVQQESPMNDPRFKVFLDKTDIANIYAPLASPDFKGNPRGPTAPENDASNSLANTQWVQNELDQLKGEIGGSVGGEFEDIDVSGDAAIENLHVRGETILDGAINAPSSTMSLNKLRLVGQDAEIYFEDNGTAPEGITKKSNIKPWGISTGEMVAQRADISSLTGGDPAGVTPSFSLKGLTEADYIHVKGNGVNPANRPHLIVEGIAEIGTLRVKNGIEGISVDGKDIYPNSVKTDDNIDVGKDLSVVGKTTLNNVVITGTVEGLTLSVDNTDIKPKSVATTDAISVGKDLTVAGKTKLSGDTTAQNLTVEGTLTADLTGENINVKTLNVTETSRLAQATIGNLLLLPETTAAQDLTATWTPSTTSNYFNIEVNKDIIIADFDTSAGLGFTCAIYVRQDSVGGHNVTLADGYKLLREDMVISKDPNSVTILQCAFSGYTGDPVDVAIYTRV